MCCYIPLTIDLRFKGSNPATRKKVKKAMKQNYLERDWNSTTKTTLLTRWQYIGHELCWMSQAFLVPKQSSFCADNFRWFSRQQPLPKLCRNLVLGAKAVAVKFHQKCWQKSAATLAPYTLCWHLRALHKNHWHYTKLGWWKQNKSLYYKNITDP